MVYDNGAFDAYRVSFYEGTRRLYSPTDEQLFSELLSLGDTYDTMAVIHNNAEQINKNVDWSFVEVATVHGGLAEEKLFSALTAMMLAEEHKEGSKLGKLIKLVGCYQVLVENRLPHIAANWSRKRSASEIERRYNWLRQGLLEPPTQLSLFG
jgi:hypothetical protein